MQWHHNTHDRAVTSFFLAPVSIVVSMFSLCGVSSFVCVCVSYLFPYLVSRHTHLLTYIAYTAPCSTRGECLLDKSMWRLWSMTSQHTHDCVATSFSLPSYNFILFAFPLCGFIFFCMCVCPLSSFISYRGIHTSSHISHTLLIAAQGGCWLDKSMWRLWSMTSQHTWLCCEVILIFSHSFLV